jgi:hypothetical protein
VAVPAAPAAVPVGVAAALHTRPGTPADQQPHVAKNDGCSIGWTISGFPYTFTGDAATGRSPQQLVEQLQRSRYPDGTLVYTIPQAQMGYQLGYGNIYDVTLRTSTGASAHEAGPEAAPQSGRHAAGAVVRQPGQHGQLAG